MRMLGLAAVLVLLLVEPAFGAFTVRNATGVDPAAIQASVDAFRGDLGGVDNGVDPPTSSGRREIKWDGVSDTFAAPAALPFDFFNVNSPRGVTFSTGGTGFQVSMDNNIPEDGDPDQVEFSHIDPTFSGSFQTFSAQRLFAPLGSNVMDVRFFRAGTVTPATTNGFGAVLTDVDASNGSSLQFFDADGVDQGTFAVPAANNGLSFLGVSFTTERIARVRITAGESAIDSPPGSDQVALDDFIYGEPQIAAKRVEFAVSEFVAAEDDGQATVTVSRGGDISGAASVKVSTSDGTATAGADYTAVTNQLVSFAADEQSKTVQIPLATDEDEEPDETVSLSLTEATGALAGPGATLRIVDSTEPVKRFGFAVSDFSVPEGDGPATITVVRSGALTAAASVDYGTVGVDAVAGSDYTESSGTLDFAVGEDEETFTVPITEDDVAESDETVTLTLTNPTSGTVVGADAVLRIVEAAPRVFSFAVSDFGVSEDRGQATISVVRSGALADPASVDFATGGGSGTATAGTDYTSSAGTLNFGAGESEQTFTVPVAEDAVAEAEETVRLTLGNPTLGVVGPAATLRIADTAARRLAFAVSSFSVAEDDGQATITVARSGPLSGAASVNYDTTNGSARAGEDYTSSSGTLSFADGQDSRTFTVPVAEDTREEADETLALRLTGPTNAVAGPDASLRIVDTTEPARRLAFAVSGFSVAEDDGQATITVLRSGPLTGAASVNFQTIGGSATSGADYTSSSGTLSFAAGQDSRTFTVPVAEDAAEEADETLTLRLTGPTNAAAGPDATLRIVDMTEPVRRLAFAVSDFSVAEDDGQATITVVRSGPLTGAASVRYQTANGSARAGEDYTSSSGTLSFGSGQDSRTFTVPVAEDTREEADETVALRLTGPSNATAGPGASLRIVDSTEPPRRVEFAVSDFSVAEDDGAATITVLRSGSLTGTASVGYSTIDGSADAGQDYTSSTGTLEFSDGEDRETFMVPVAQDSVQESDETVTLRLSNASNATAGPDATLRIVDATEPVGEIEFAVEEFTVAESGGEATITVIRSGPLTGSASVDYATLDGTATAGEDYSATEGTLEFGPGDDRLTFSVPVAEDALDEGDEIVNLTLSGASGATAGEPATLRILDTTDPPPPPPPAANDDSPGAGVPNTTTIVEQGPRDRTAPGLTLARVPKVVSVKALLRGLRVTATTDEISSLDFELRGRTRRATLAATFDLTLAEVSLAPGTGRRSARLKPSRKIVGRARRLNLQLRVTAIDASGNKTVVTRRIRARR